MVFNYAEQLLSEDEQIFRLMSSQFKNYSEKGGVTREKWLQRISDSTLSTIENVEALYDHIPPTQVTYILQRYRQSRAKTIELLANEPDRHNLPVSNELTNFQAEIRRKSNDLCRRFDQLFKVFSSE